MDSHDSHDPGVKNRSPSPHPNAQYTSATANTDSSGTNSYNSYSAGYLSANPQPGLPMAQSFEASLMNQLEQSSPANMQIPPEENFSNLLNSNQADFDFALYQNTTSPNSTTAPEYDSSLLLDPQIQQQQQQQQPQQQQQQSRPSSQAINPADLASSISSPQDPTSPSQDYLHQNPSPGPISPASSAGPYYTPQHSRHTSLDPSTAAYLTNHHSSEWPSMAGNSAFQDHRRAPSEVSDVSSIHSPYLSQHESFDGVENSNPSPLLAPQNDPGLYDNTLGIESFTLSGQQQQQQQPPQQQGFSPGHSPYLSPQLVPQQGPEMIPNIPYISAPTDPGNNNNAQYPNPPDMFGSGVDAMGMDIGQASQMAPPSINVELAPPSRNPTMGGLGKTTDIDSLSPPPRMSFFFFFFFPGCLVVLVLHQLTLHSRSNPKCF